MDVVITQTMTLTSNDDNTGCHIFMAAAAIGQEGSIRFTVNYK